MNGINAVSSLTLFKLQPFNQLEKSSGGPFDKAFDTLSQHMEHLSKEAQAYYDALEQKTELSKQATALLQNFDKDKAKAFLQAHDGSKDWSKVTDEQELREGLENFKTAQTDFVAESQLKIQRIMQTYNTTATLMNSLQSMLADLNKTIIQALR
jgi:EspA-like secreted protein